MKLKLLLALCLAPALHAAAPTEAELDQANPVQPLPGKLLGHDQAVADLPNKPDPQKVRLGRWLYFDKRLSADGTISCASCHDPKAGFSERKPVSEGIRGQKGNRKAPSFINAVYAFTPDTFWDGRAKSLEEQAKGPIANPIEMGHTHDACTQGIAGVKGYAPFFTKAFGDDKVTIDRIAEAIAHYERTRVSGNSPYDKWKAQKDKGAGEAASDLKLGEELFNGKAKCVQCHVGNAFTDSMFHNLGIGYDEKTGKFADEGRAKITGKKEHTGAFKTPGLRDTALHPPYMHDGSLPTLEAVVEHYDKGGTPNPYLDQKMVKLGLTADEKKALVKFMEALTGEGYMDEEPKLFPQ
jgi:cytochrome c peroxidase